MGKKKKSKKRTKRVNIRKPKALPKPVSTQSTRERIFLYIKKFSPWKKLLSLISLLGFIYLIFSFYPRVTISVGKNLDPTQPFKTLFLIQNNGHLSVKDINYSISFVKIEDINHNEFYSIPGSSLKTKSLYTIPSIRPGYSSPINISTILVSPGNYFLTVDIYIKYSYKSDYIPITFSDSLRFKTHRDINGHYFWFEYHDK